MVTKLGEPEIILFLNVTFDSDCHGFIMADLKNS